MAGECQSPLVELLLKRIKMELTEAFSHKKRRRFFTFQPFPEKIRKKTEKISRVRLRIRVCGYILPPN